MVMEAHEFLTVRSAWDPRVLGVDANAGVLLVEGT